MNLVKPIKAICFNFSDHHLFLRHPDDIAKHPAPAVKHIAVAADCHHAGFACEFLPGAKIAGWRAMKCLTFHLDQQRAS
jgi:hypothetical protein